VAQRVRRDVFGEAGAFRRFLYDPHVINDN
jgi:hypothetical protein